MLEKNEFNDRKIKYELINGIRIGDITQNFTSVDIEEVFKCDGYIVKIIEIFICDTLEFNPMERFIITDKTDQRNKFKHENKTLLQTLTTKISNSVYGGCLRRVIEES